MVEKVRNAQDSYIKNYMAKMPNIEKGEARVIKKGDNLWNIARSQLGKNSKRGQVNDYMLAIAKLNGLDTSDKMNNLKINTTIYLPKNSSVKSNTQPIIKTQPNNIQKTQAEKCFDDRIKTFLNDKTVTVKKADIPELYSELYHVSYSKEDKKGYIHRDKPVMSVTISKDTKKIEEISFEDDKNIYSFGYDYKIEKDNIIRSSHALSNQTYGKITPKQRDIIEKTLFQHINKK